MKYEIWATTGKLADGCSSSWSNPSPPLPILLVKLPTPPNPPRQTPYPLPILLV